MGRDNPARQRARALNPVTHKLGGVGDPFGKVDMEADRRDNKKRVKSCEAFAAALRAAGMAETVNDKPSTECPRSLPLPTLSPCITTNFR